MPMSVVIVRNAPDRFRGFLASCMLEAAPGIYSHPEMSRGVRERIWGVLEDWFVSANGASVVLLWADKSVHGGLGILTLGEPPRSLLDYDGVILSRLEHNQNK